MPTGCVSSVSTELHFERNRKSHGILHHFVNNLNSTRDSHAPCWAGEPDSVMQQSDHLHGKIIVPKGTMQIQQRNLERSASSMWNTAFLACRFNIFSEPFGRYFTSIEIESDLTACLERVQGSASEMGWPSPKRPNMKLYFDKLQSRDRRLILVVDRGRGICHNRTIGSIFFGSVIF
jgi:hypothetical protein